MKAWHWLVRTQVLQKMFGRTGTVLCLVFLALSLYTGAWYTDFISSNGVQVLCAYRAHGVEPVSQGTLLGKQWFANLRSSGQATLSWGANRFRPQPGHSTLTERIKYRDFSSSRHYYFLDKDSTLQWSLSDKVDPSVAEATLLSLDGNSPPASSYLDRIGILLDTVAGDYRQLTGMTSNHPMAWLLLPLWLTRWASAIVWIPLWAVAPTRTTMLVWTASCWISLAVLFVRFFRSPTKEKGSQLPR